MMSQRVIYSALFKKVRVIFQTYDCCIESFVVKQGALFIKNEKARNIPLSCLSNPYRMKKNK